MPFNDDELEAAKIACKLGALEMQATFRDAKVATIMLHEGFRDGYMLCTDAELLQLKRAIDRAIEKGKAGEVPGPWDFEEKPAEEEKSGE